MKTARNALIVLACFAPAWVAAQTPKVTAPNVAANIAAYPYELITLNRFGVYPQQITRPKGPFLLVIENQRASRDEIFNIVLVRDSAGKTISSPGPSLASLASNARKGRMTTLLNLQPGQYKLSLTKESQLQVTITITD